MKKENRIQGKSYPLQRGISILLLAGLLAAQVAGCGSTQTSTGDSQSESSVSEATADSGLAEDETEEASQAAESSEEAAVAETENTETSENAEVTESQSTEAAASAETEDTNTESGDETNSESGEDSDSESADDTTAQTSGDDTAELNCQLLYEAVAAEAADGIAMVTAKEECTFLTAKYRELLEDFYYAADPEQVYCVCIVKADSESSAESIKEEFDDTLLSMQNDMYLTTDEQKVAKAGVTGISGQYVWYISLSEDSSVMSAAEAALLAKLG